MNSSEYYNNFDKEYYTTGGYDDYKERFIKEYSEIIVPAILKQIKPEKTWNFLDVGCALGGNIIALNNLGFNAKGIEISPYCLANSPVKDKMCFGEAFKIPFKNKSFEVVICMDVFMYLTNKQILQSIQELIRVSSKYIIFSTIDKDSKNASQEYNPDELRADTVHLYSSDDYIDLFKKQGAKFLTKDIFPPKWDFSAVFHLT